MVFFVYHAFFPQLKQKIMFMQNILINEEENREWKDIHVDCKTHPLRKKYPYSEYFSVLGLNTELYRDFSLFSPNVGKYGPKNSEYGHFSRSDQ